MWQLRSDDLITSFLSPVAFTAMANAVLEASTPRQYLLSKDQGENPLNGSEFATLVGGKTFRQSLGESHGQRPLPMHRLAQGHAGKNDRLGRPCFAISVISRSEACTEKIGSLGSLASKDWSSISSAPKIGMMNAL